MLLRYSFGLVEDADLVEKAVENVLAAGIRTADIATPGTTRVSTTAMGTALLAELDRLAA
jgi:3-isopropylmalate dehydrogenase